MLLCPGLVGRQPGDRRAYYEASLRSPPSSLQRAAFFDDDALTDLGAWARYPSHTRPLRTGSAGIADGVVVRDFAVTWEGVFGGLGGVVEAISGTNRFASRRERTPSSMGWEGTHWLVRPLRWVWDGVCRYARFLSEGSDYHRHGHGHRTSISLGGTLRSPELELL